VCRSQIQNVLVRRNIKKFEKRLGRLYSYITIARLWLLGPWRCSH